MDSVLTSDAPAPAGHYAQAVVHDDLIFVSGQLPVHPETGEKQTGAIEDQAEQALQNVAAVVREAGADLEHVLKTTVYVTDVQLWDRVNEVYAAFFGEHRPARAVVPTRSLHYGFDIEVEAVARRPKGTAANGTIGAPERRVTEVETPALLIEQSRLQSNLERMQRTADQNGADLRPHIKTHKSVALASRQQSLGARGITVAKTTEAEVFVSGGIEDVRIAYPVVGEGKHARILRLMDEARVSFCVDTAPGAQMASDFYAARDAEAEVLLKVDCGYGRAGVPWDDPEGVSVAHRVSELPGLKLVGILTHAGQSYHGPHEGESASDALCRVAEQERDRMLSFAASLHEADVPGVSPNADFEISIGSTPTMSAFEGRTHRGFSVTEIRPGTYSFYDRTQVALGAAEIEDCALTVLATVVSRHPEEGGVRLIIDAGKKVFTTDKRHGTEGFGRLLADPATMAPIPGANLHSLSEEHGWIHVDGTTDLEVGDTVRIVPNHACVTVHTQDQMALVDGSDVVETWPVDARGCVR